MIAGGDVSNSASARKRETASVALRDSFHCLPPLYRTAETAAPPKIKDYTVRSGAAMKRFCAAAWSCAMAAVRAGSARSPGF
jgi:hypothetical protein